MTIPNSPSISKPPKARLAPADSDTSVAGTSSPTTRPRASTARSVGAGPHPRPRTPAEREPAVALGSLPHLHPVDQGALQALMQQQRRSQELAQARDTPLPDSPIREGRSSTDTRGVDTQDDTKPASPRTSTGVHEVKPSQPAEAVATASGKASMESASADKPLTFPRLLAEIKDLVQPDISVDRLKAPHTGPRQRLQTSGQPLTAAEKKSIAEFEVRMVEVMPTAGEKRGLRAEIRSLAKDMESDHELREECMNVIADDANCHDRALTTWQNVKTIRLARQAEIGVFDLNRLFSIGRGMSRMEKVDAYTAKLADKEIYGESESTEMILRARQILQRKLRLPIPATKGFYTENIEISVPGLSRQKLSELADQILAEELENDGDALTTWMSNWMPITQLLSKAPELKVMRDEIDKRQEQISEALTDKMGIITDGLYMSLMQQASAEHDASQIAIGRLAIERFMGKSKTPLEKQMGGIREMSDPAKARELVPLIRAALKDGSLRPEWKHPTSQWNWLHVAAAAGDAELTTELLALDVPIQEDSDLNEPIHLAVRHSDPSILAQLAAKEKDSLRRPNGMGNLVIHLAADSGSRAAVEAAVHAGADVNSQHQRNGQSALHIAASKGDLPLLKALLSMGGNPRLRTREDKDVLALLEEKSQELSFFDWEGKAAYKAARDAVEQAARLYV
jgi:hypothetical protein